MNTQNQHNGLSPQVIRALMMMNKIGQNEIARECDRSEPHVSNVIEGRRRSYAVQEHIAGKLGLPYEIIWGPKTDRQAA